MQTKPSRSFNDLIKEQFKDPELALAYLNEMGLLLKDGNQEDIKHLMLSLYHISRAQGKDELYMVPYLPDFISTLTKLGIVMQFKYLVDCVDKQEKQEPYSDKS
jgi:hypothetical protein